MYNDSIIERLSNLKYVGKLKHYNACGMSDKKFDENDKVKLFLNISKDGIIQNASFKAVGCTGVLVSASFICEMLEDKDLKFAKKLDVIAVNRYMGSEYAVIKQHAILVVLNALLNTLKAYDKALSLNTVSYYEKLIEKPKKVKSVTQKETVKKQTKVEKSKESVKEEKISLNKDTVVVKEDNASKSVDVVETVKTAKAKKSTKKDVSVKVVDDVVIVEEKEAQVESNEAKSKGLLNLLSNIKKDKQVEETKEVSNKSNKVASSQISFDFNELGTEKPAKAKKVKPKKEKVEKPKKNKKAKIVNPLATTYEDDVVTTKEVAPTLEVVEVEPIVSDNEVIVEDAVVETPVVTKTVRTKTTKKTTKTVVSKVNESVELEHTSNAYDAETLSVETNGETTKNASIEKMNSSLLRLQNLQKKTANNVEVKEEPISEDNTKEESLNKLKALVASAKQSKAQENKPVNKVTEAKVSAPKKETKKAEPKEQPKTQGSSVKYVRLGEFEEKTKKEKKGLFSRIFNRK